MIELLRTELWSGVSQECSLEDVDATQCLGYKYLDFFKDSFVYIGSVKWDQFS